MLGQQPPTGPVCIAGGVWQLRGGARPDWRPDVKASAFEQMGPATLRLHYRTHTRARLKLRYKLEMTSAEYDAVADAVRTGTAHVGPVDAYGRQVGWVQQRGQWVFSGFRGRAHPVIT